MTREWFRLNGAPETSKAEFQVIFPPDKVKKRSDVAKTFNALLSMLLLQYYRVNLIHL